MPYSRRSPDERYSSSRETDTYDAEGYHSEHRWRYHRHHDDYENYATETRYDHSSRSRYEYDYVEDRSHYSSFREVQHSTTDQRRGEPLMWNPTDANFKTSQSRYSEKERTHHSDSTILVESRRSSSESPPPLIPTSPSPEYLKIAAESSKPISYPPRKLLILDLNGTLLVRVRSKGAIYPRPYMPAFRDFLLCPATREWLDVMVWSSAQPHNVERMVRRCFFDARLGVCSGEGKSEEKEQSDVVGKDIWDWKMIAVWARDTLGLTRKDYSRKAQTTKDLEKPWLALPGNHGAQTTVLLDDSPRKARLQPFNHVCINEYDLAQRDHDLSVKRWSLKRRDKTEEPEEAEVDKRRGEHHGSVDSDGKDVELTDRQKARKKKKADKKMRQVTDSGCAELEKAEGYDSTLLAVIGILDALKQESNVAGWIRSGGLWAGRPPPDLHTSAEKDTVHVGSEEQMSSPTDLEFDEKKNTSRPVSPSQAKRQRSTGCDVVGSSIGDMKRTKFNLTEGNAEDEHLIGTGNDAETVGAVADTHGATKSPLRVGATTSKGSHTKMWFEDEETLRIWVNRGRAALKELGIEGRDGIEVD